MGVAGKNSMRCVATTLLSCLLVPSGCGVDRIETVPVSGEVIAVNEELSNILESLGDDPYGAGWIAKIRISDDSSLGDLMDFAAYQKQCAEEE